MPDQDKITRLNTEIDARRDDLIALTQDLIRIPTLNPPGENYRLICEYLETRLKPRGFECKSRFEMKPRATAINIPAGTSSHGATARTLAIASTSIPTQMWWNLAKTGPAIPSGVNLTATKSTAVDHAT